MRRKQLFTTWFLLLALVATVFAPAAHAQPSSAGRPPRGSVKIDRNVNAHPRLQYGAAAEPEKLVRVIVVRASTRHTKQDIDKVARAHGGRLIEELKFINGYVVEVKQKEVLKIAKHPHVKYVAYDGPTQKTDIDASLLKTTYDQAIGAPTAWNNPFGATTGKGVTVAVIDSGVAQHADLTNVVRVSVTDAPAEGDASGHGTHVAGIIAGRASNGTYIGVAPDARIVSVKVARQDGSTMESDLLRGMQWVLDNRLAYNIKVVNISMNGAIAESYTHSLLAAAVEQLWFNGVIVVASAGNRGAAQDATWYGPGNDPFVITTGALDTNETAAGSDDRLADFSSRGKTQDGFAKPDVVAPGRKIVSTLAAGSSLAKALPDRIVDRSYVRLSGTSMATPVVAGLIALVLEDNPYLTPDQMKWLVTASAARYQGQADTAGAVNVMKALLNEATGKLGAANAGIVPNMKADPVTGLLTFGTSNYWESNYWESNYWESNYWESNYWESNYWESTVLLDSYYWDE